MSVTIHQGDCLDVLRTLPDASIHCCVTSPPYYGLRSYLPDVVQLRADIPEAERARIIEDLETLGIFPIMDGV